MFCMTTPPGTGAFRERHRTIRLHFLEVLQVNSCGDWAEPAALIPA